MIPKTHKIVSPDQFDKLFREDALIAEFASPDEKVAYERRDSLLIDLIRREAEQHFGSDQEQQPFIGDDWWPDHTRHMVTTPSHCTRDFLAALCSLLKDDYEDYRIQICVYADMMDGKTYIGSMNLHADRILIERKLYKLLQGSLLS